MPTVFLGKYMQWLKIEYLHSGVFNVLHVSFYSLRLPPLASRTCCRTRQLCSVCSLAHAVGKFAGLQVAAGIADSHWCWWKVWKMSPLTGLPSWGSERDSVGPGPLSLTHRHYTHTHTQFQVGDPPTLTSVTKTGKPSQVLLRVTHPGVSGFCGKVEDLWVTGSPLRLQTSTESPSLTISLQRNGRVV